MNFTGTATEYMMQSNRAGNVKRGQSENALPPEHPCFGCSYARNQSCIGYCIKKLMQKGDNGK